MSIYERHEKEIADVLAACERENRIYFKLFKETALDIITKPRNREIEARVTEWELKKAFSYGFGSKSRFQAADAELTRLEKERNAPIPEDLDSLYAQLRKVLSKGGSV
jgi:hypothetical protein